MTKPWEETWAPGDCLVHSKDANIAETNLAPNEGVTSERAETCARFIAAAPDMARALLAVEWAGFAVDQSDVCPDCGSGRIHESRRMDGEIVAPGKHSIKCALGAALRKAGVR